MPLASIHVNNLNLWAHVGVYEQERLFGQLFVLDFTISFDLDEATNNDNLDSTADYSLAIKALQNLSMDLNCLTIEYFSGQVLDCLERLYGKVPMRIILRKCHPPVPGFNGHVCIEQSRYFETD